MITNEKIIDLHINGKFTYTQIADEHGMTRNKIAGILWRYHNPGMWTKNIKTKDHDHHRSDKNHGKKSIK